MSPSSGSQALGHRPHDKRMLALSALAGFGLAIALIGRLVFSGYSILDDHDVVSWLGPNHRLAFSSIWHVLMSTEIGDSVGRFRPVMYGLMVFEDWLWGPHPSGFHVVAVLWFAIFLWGVAWIAFRSIGVLAGCAVLFLVVNGRFWSNIFTHSVMVSEQPALLGLGLGIFGYGLASSWFLKGGRGRFDTAVLLVSLGALICAGAKENFQPPVAFSILLLLAAWRMKAIRGWSLAGAIVLDLLGVAVCLRVILPNLGQEGSLLFRLWAVYHSRLFIYVAVAVGGGIASLVFGRRERRKRDDWDARAWVVLGFFLLGAGLYLAWELFFYDGRMPYGFDGLMPYGQRYDFPGLMIYPVLAGSLCFTVLQLRKRLPWAVRQFSPFALQLCFALLIVNLGTFYYAQGRLLPVISAVETSNRNTQKMEVDLRSSKILADRHPDWPIFVVAVVPMDYEAAVSAASWFCFYGIANPISLVVGVAPRDITSDSYRGLVRAMEEISAGGDKARGYEPATPAMVAGAQAQGHCYVVNFQDVHSPCTKLTYRPDQYFPEH